MAGLGLAILLFQDLIAIPLLAAIPLLGGVKNETCASRMQWWRWARWPW